VELNVRRIAMLNSSGKPAAETNVNFAYQLPWPRWRVVVVALILLLAPGAVVVNGQQSYLQTVGVPVFDPKLPVQNGFINTSNGDLHLEIPLGNFQQRGGHQFKAALMYDSNIWVDVGGGWWDPTNVPDGYGGTMTPLGGPAGWRLVTSASKGGIHFSAAYSWCSHDGKIESITYTGWYWVAPDGTNHGSFHTGSIQFPTVRTVQTFQTFCGHGAGDTPASDGVEINGSGYHMYVTNYTTVAVFAPNGTRVNAAEDSNGNYSTYTSSANPSPLTDELGRNLITTTVNGNNIYYDVLNSQGSTSRYTVTTETLNVSTGFLPCNSCTEYRATIIEIQSIQLPDGTSYSFQYDSGTGASHYGTLTSMTLPTGGQISYSYTNVMLYCAQDPTHVIATYTTPDSATAWTFAINQTVNGCSPGAPGQYQNTVTKPDGHTVVYTFAVTGINNPSLSTGIQSYSGSVSSANLVATFTQGFNFAAFQPLPTSATITLPGPGGVNLNQTTQYSWDNGGPSGGSQYAQLLKKQEWNFYTGNLPATPDRTTNIAYLAGSGYLNSNTYIVDRPISVTVTNSSGGTVSQTLNCYDFAGGCGGSSFADAGSITNHDANFGPSYTFRGDLTQTQRLITGSSYLTESMKYDSAGQLLSATDWSNLGTHTTSYSYTDHYVDDNTSNTEPLATHSLTQATNGYPSTVTAPISAASMTYTYYYGTGQKSSATDANGRTSYWHFGDPLDRPTSTKQPNGGWDYFVYTGANTIDKGIGITSATLSTNCTGSGDCWHEETQLDDLARTDHKLLVSDPDGQTNVDTTYDLNGRFASDSNPHRASSSSTDGTESYPAYDGLDRKLKVIRADGSIVYTYYGPAVSSNGGASSQLCSGFGLGYPMLTIDEAGHKQQRWTDGFGRLIEVDEPNSTNTLSVGTCYAYDLNDNLIGVLSLGGSESKCPWNSTYNRCYSYDMTSRLLTAYNPEAGTITYTYDQDTNCPSPNSFVGQLESKTDARGNRTCFQYDNLNRVTQKNYPSSTTSTVTFSYDSTSCLDVPTCYNLNRRTGMIDGSGQTSWAYDPVGNILEEKRTIGTVIKNVLYTYNRDSSVATIQYPSGRVLTYQPGDAQRPIQVVDSVHSINYATAAHYAPPGELASLTNGGSFFFTSIFNNRLQPCWAYATTGTPLTWNSTNTSFCTTSATTGSILDIKYNFNWGTSDNGNVIGITNDRNNTRSQSFAYDNLNRLQTAETTSTYSTSPTNCWAEQYTIDPVGNLTSIGASGNSNYNGCAQESGTSLSVNGNNQIVGFCYDAAGNLLLESSSCSSPTYGYDSESRLTSANGFTYTYDGDGKRVEKSNGTLYWYGTSSDPIAETDASGNDQNEYIYFTGKRIARQDSSNNIFYYFADHLGTAREIIQAGQTSVCYDADFYPFGGERTVVDTCDSHYKFTGKERDLESGLDNFGARFDSSQMGRFMTPDWSEKPMGVPYAVLDDPQSLNLYSYVRNNPLAKADPDGHCALCETILDLIASGMGSSDALWYANHPAQQQQAQQQTMTVTYVSGDNPDPQSNAPSAQSGTAVTYEVTISPALPKGDGTIKAHLGFEDDRPVRGEVGLTDSTGTAVTKVVANQNVKTDTTTIRTTAVPYETRNNLGGSGPGHLIFTVTASDGTEVKGSTPVYIVTPAGNVANRNPVTGRVQASSPIRTSLTVQVPGP
jgi:RHS repeat-associated protein